jgi:hypothetical protein
VAEIAALVAAAIGPACDTADGSAWRNLDRGYALHPTDDVMVFLLVAVAAGYRDTVRLARWLDTLSSRRSCLVPTAADLGSLAADSGIAERLVRAPTPNPDCPSQVAFRIATPDLFPESLGYDSVTSNFYIGSLFRRHIYRVRRDGDRAELDPFTRPARIASSPFSE